MLYEVITQVVQFVVLDFQYKKIVYRIRIRRNVELNVGNINSGNYLDFIWLLYKHQSTNVW